MSALTPPDAAMYWRSLTTANDQFLLYAFDAPDDPSADPFAELAPRASEIADLRLGVARVPWDLGYPRWRASRPRPEQFCRHPATTWTECLAALGHLMASGDRTAGPLWRLHLFESLTDVPDADGPANIVVLQISHALGGGRRVSAIARRLLTQGRPDRVRSGAPLPSAVASAVAAAAGAAAIVPRLATGTVAGAAAWMLRSRCGTAETPGADVIEPTVLNRPDPGAVELRTVTLPRSSVRRLGSSVTVGALVGLAEVLGRFGGTSPDGRVVAEVAVSREPATREPAARRRNDFFSVGVDLRPDLDRRARSGAIASQLDAARRRDRSAVARVDRWAADRAPSVLGSLAVRLSSAAPVPERVAGATVVSSVNRGDGDLRLAGGRVLFTAGFPALSAVHGLTHGVHGIGATVTVSIAARGTAARTVDEYAAAVRAAFGGSPATPPSHA
ncbi:hypothetical protein ACE11G_04960 [Gordonia sp. PS3]|uniref:O-acyltransferase WSD1 C-terminal domain-containing protein n=1 Tax=Gordonia sihwensis NBRC 108236 TaxID=1223544 RepID=L7LHU5_9ACTN|nr:MULTISPECIES: hypothetical protein [Gordonia]AUH68359.1 hypothetical protein CXX93_08330 [Gordonia sp. YC-JH1]GAC60449.1 hypothetical protein GSI01S_10_00410 [Gordonia sihwensis NBRC 108236]